jgi:ribonucleotide reductase beta subunit family protein with ferritin-like domain
LEIKGDKRKMTETTKMIKAIANDSKVRIDRIVANYEQLEKENAELKEQHEVSARNMSSFIESLSKSENEAKKQLTKAKEIIHKVCYEYGIYDKDLMEEAKQFLKEE